MSGILDSKSRIIDAIFTAEGRRQLAEGTFEISYATFSDAAVSYVPDAVNGHEDPSPRIYFEACNLPQDQITFEANDEGKVVPLRIQNIKLSTPEGQFLSPSAEGALSNGSLTAYQRYYGRRIKTSFIKEDSDDLDRGFVYSDATGLTASILVNPNIKAGNIESSSGAPWKAYVGTRGGLGPKQFAQAISGAIAALSGTVGGPKVSVVATNDSVFIDINESIGGSRLFVTGTLSSPLLLEEAALGGKILTGEVENASFATQIDGILTSSFDNFQELQTIGSVNYLLQDYNFSLSTGSIDFDMSRLNSRVIRSLKASPPSLNSIDSVFSDDKLSHLENFRYLPPIVKTSDALLPDKSNVDSLTPYLLGDYPSWGDNEKVLTFSKLMKNLKKYSSGVSETVFVSESSVSNKLIGQFFEVTDNIVNKMDVIDFGEVMNDSQSSSVVSNRVFFVGKTFIDNRGTTCFVNVFTLIFSRVSDQERDRIR